MTAYTNGEMDNYQRNVYDNLQYNQRRRMQLQSNLQSQQRNHRLRRAACLQRQWLEISEKERKAHIHNQKLLQNFQKAEDMLNDMVARTEAMNTIRVQYEQYLEENFPQWQQRLKDIRVSKKSKRVQQYLEEDEGINTEHMSDYRAQPLFFNPPDPSQTSCIMGTTHQTANDIKQNVHYPYLPPTWLSGSHPFISGLPQNNFPKDYKNLQNIQALNTSYYTVPGNSHHQSHPPVQQETPSVEHLWQGLLPTAAPAPWQRFPMLNPMMDVPDSSQERIQQCERNKENVSNEAQKPNKESCLRVKHRRNGKESDRSSELDSRPVRLSVDHGRRSEGSTGSSETTVSGMQKQRKKKRDGTKSQSTENSNKSQCSSTVSQDASESYLDTKIRKPHQNSSERYSSEESIIRKKNVEAVSADEDVTDKNRSQEIPQNNMMPEQKDGSTKREDDDSDEGDDDIIVAKGKIRGTYIKEEDEEGTCEEDDAGYNAEDAIRKRVGIEASDKEDAGIDDDAHKNDEDVEEEDEEGTGEEEKAGSDDDDEVMGQRVGIEASDEEEPERHREVQDDNADGETTEEGERENCFQKENKGGNTQGSVEDDKKVNSLERDNSLEELYSDETEEDEVSNQEVDDYDDEDEVVVEKAHPWSQDPFEGHAKCSDDDDDIEGLLNPVNSQTQKAEDVEVTNQSNDELSSSEEESLPQKSHHPAATNKPVESDDEFDHFYD